MLTITEALAEIKTISKRLGSKRTSVLQYLARQDGVKDPLDKELVGGSPEFIRRERQAIADLEERIISIRRGIASANHNTTITIGDQTRSIEDWLVWRREVSGGQRQFLAEISGGLNRVRTNAHQNRVNVIAQGQPAVAAQDWVINLSESDISAQSESLENVLGTLDGLLSLKNATTTIEE